MPDLAGTKAVFDNGAFKWEAGEAIACFQRFDKEYVAAESNVLTKMWATDVDGNFSGNLPYTALTEKTKAYAMNFIYPASVVKKIIDASGSTALVECVQVELPAVQDGRMEYLGDYFITGAYNVSCTAQTVGEAVESITTDSDVVLNKYQVVCLKLNVPEDLNIQRVAVKAFAGDRERGIAGKANLNIRNNQIKGNNNWSSKVVSIEHDDESVRHCAGYASGGCRLSCEFSCRSGYGSGSAVSAGLYYDYSGNPFRFCNCMAVIRIDSQHGITDRSFYGLLCVQACKRTFT
jgi:hypothetical protein